MNKKNDKKEYWNSLLTEKSWQILQNLRREYNFILIGGWAVYLHTRQQKSKDVDIVVDINELEKLKKQGLGKNDQLKKYEIKKEEVDIDIYVEHYSKLAIPVEDIKKHTIKIEGFEVVKTELLILLKQTAFKDRENSIRGEKDKIDIVSLIFFADTNLNLYAKIAKEYRIDHRIDELKEIVNNFKDYNSLGIGPQELKKMKKEFILNWRKIK
ncbi:MAG: hypothetical protein AABW75_02080 [Nanoarchaeota archaeon]